MLLHQTLRNCLLYEIARRNSFIRCTAAPFMFHHVLGAAFIPDYNSSVLEFENSLVLSDLFLATKVRLGREI